MCHALKISSIKKRPRLKAFLKEGFIRPLLAKKEDRSWSMEFKPPVVCLDRTEHMSMVLESCKHFHTSGRGEMGQTILKEFA